MKNNDFDRFIQSVRQDQKLVYEPEKPASRRLIGASLGAVSGLVFGTAYYSFNHLIHLPIVRMQLGFFDILLRILLLILLGTVIGLATNWLSDWAKGILFGEILLIISLEARAYLLPEATPYIFSAIFDNNAYLSFLAISAVGMKILYSLPITLSLRFVTSYQIENRNNSRIFWKRILLVVFVLITAGMVGAYLPDL